jgi:hypothetical protein
MPLMAAFANLGTTLQPSFGHAVGLELEDWHIDNTSKK